ncbi:DUF6894 family protein [Sphingomonas sp. RS2018]
MPRYHFNVHAAGSHISDGEGVVLRCDSVAIERAQQIVRDIISTDVRDEGVVNLAQTIEILSSDGSVVGSIGFAEIIRIARD